MALFSKLKLRMWRLFRYKKYKVQFSHSRSLGFIKKKFEYLTKLKFRTGSNEIFYRVNKMAKTMSKKMSKRSPSKRKRKKLKLKWRTNPQWKSLNWLTKVKENNFIDIPNIFNPMKKYTFLYLKVMIQLDLGLVLDFMIKRNGAVGN